MEIIVFEKDVCDHAFDLYDAKKIKDNLYVYYNILGTNPLKYAKKYVKIGAEGNERYMVFDTYEKCIDELSKQFVNFSITDYRKNEDVTVDMGTYINNRILYNRLQTMHNINDFMGYDNISCEEGYNDKNKK
jgi:hypothetical protein